MQFLPFINEDYGTVYEFMRPLWLETYGKILPEKQILFLLDKYFSKNGLSHYLALGYQYRKIDDCGVCVFVERETDVYLDKLYLLPAARGKGYPQKVFAELQKCGKPITLNVNEANKRALACYKKNGFEIVRQELINLGNGMINRDFILQKPIAF